MFATIDGVERPFEACYYLQTFARSMARDGYCRIARASCQPSVDVLTGSTETELCVVRRHSAETWELRILSEPKTASRRRVFVSSIRFSYFEQSQSSCTEYEAIYAVGIGIVLLCCCCFLMRPRSDYRSRVPSSLGWTRTLSYPSHSVVCTAGNRVHILLIAVYIHWTSISLCVGMNMLLVNYCTW